MKDLIEDALEMIYDRPKEEIELMHYVLTMDDELKAAFLIAYQLWKNPKHDEQDA